MGIFFKEYIQKKIHDAYTAKYEKELAIQKDSYQAYIEEKESEQMKRQLNMPRKWEEKGNTLVVSLESIGEESFSLEGLLMEHPMVETIFFASQEGTYSEEALFKVQEAFAANPGKDVLYANEDILGEDGKRKDPWFKPAWSPDTLFSFFYFGNVFAVRKTAIESVPLTTGTDWLEKIYDMVLRLTDEKEAFLLDEVLYHKREASLKKREEYEGYGCQKKYDKIKLLAAERRGFKLKMKEEEGISHPVFTLDGQPKISILIPSKDHPKVLYRCVESLRRISTYQNYEIIVIDNGSSEENKKQYLQYGKEFSYSYLYSPMDFNFSKMCNMAAKNATGELFLLLNDDMEIMESDWLERLAGTALLPHVGAVGAKLYYPGTDLIQHVGITNMYEGPVHKLMKKSDSRSYYHGKNRFLQDVIGVTAACLMVTREKYFEVGGFCEGLKVAYNDVDFCFGLHQKGYYNIIRNDVILYHHESLSRGDDLQDEGKKQRLRKEGEFLYTNNPGYYDFDPFYSKHLTGVSEEYFCVLPYENRNVKPCEAVKLIKGNYPKVERNETLIIKTDHAKYQQFSMEGETPGYLIDLHAHIRGLDSCDYRYRMVLKGESGCYEIPAKRRLRPDVVKTFANEIHVELSGFVAKIPVGLLPKGEYEIWMEADSVLSRQLLCNKAENTLKVDK